MVVYITLLFFMIISVPLEKRSSSLYLNINLLLLWVISAFRAVHVGNDTVTYTTLYPILADYPLSMYGNNVISALFSRNRFEIGYVIFDKVLYIINHNPRLLIVVSITIFILCLRFYIKNSSNNIMLSLIFFVTLGYYGLCLSAMRQMIALGFLMVAYVFLNRNNSFLFVLYVILATSFHLTSIVFLIVYFFKKIKFSFKKLTISVVVLTLIFTNFNKIFMDISWHSSYGSYYQIIQNNTGYLGILFNVIVNVILLFSCILVAGKQKEDHNLDIWMALVGCMVSILAFKFNQLGRLAYYFTFVFISFLPNEILEVNRAKLKFYYNGIAILLSIIYFLVIQILRPEWTGIVPYNFM